MVQEDGSFMVYPLLLSFPAPPSCLPLGLRLFSSDIQPSAISVETFVFHSILPACVLQRKFQYGVGKPALVTLSKD